MWGALYDERTVLSFTTSAGLASAVILGSESRGTRDHILLSQIRDFPFRRLLRLTGSQWRYSTPPPVTDSLYRLRTDNIKTLLILVEHCYTRFPATSCIPRVSLRGNLFIEPLPTNGNPCYNMLVSKYDSSKKRRVHPNKACPLYN
jgi:hypothetical protein